MRYFTMDFGDADTSEEGVGFQLEGKVDGEPWTESFETLARIPAGALADLRVREWSFAAAGCVNFIAGVLKPESEERFLALVRDKRRLVKDTKLIELTRRLIEEFTERPTEPPSTSRNGSSVTVGSSTGG